MCQLALDMFAQTLRERQISFSFRYANVATLFHARCHECNALPYMPVDADLTIHGIAWQLPDVHAEERQSIVHAFKTTCIRCAVTSQAETGFWIPVRLSSTQLEYFMFDGDSLGADAAIFVTHPNEFELDVEQAVPAPQDTIYT